MGLLAGLFYAYSVSVVPGLGQADDRTLVDGMQQINEAIENPVFFVGFLGAPVPCSRNIAEVASSARGRAS